MEEASTEGDGRTGRVSGRGWLGGSATAAGTLHRFVNRAPNASARRCDMLQSNKPPNKFKKKTFYFIKTSPVKIDADNIQTHVSHRGGMESEARAAFRGVIRGHHEIGPAGGDTFQISSQLLCAVDTHTRWWGS
eukprot:365162-Chlamydomonas_euryale.AAC.20